MDSKNTDKQDSTGSSPTVDISINTIVDHLSRLTTHVGSNTSPNVESANANVVVTTSPSLDHAKILQTLQKAVNFSPILHKTDSGVPPKPQSLDDYLKEWEKAGSPEPTVHHCKLEGNPNGIFCIWIAYKDMDIPPFWKPLESVTEPLPYCVKKIPGFGQGVVATRPLAAGDLIVIDRPILITPLATIMDRSELEQCLEENIQLLRMKERKLLEDLSDCLPASVGGKWRRIRLTNAVTVEFPDSKLPHYGAVFPIIARCNHSCGPNATSYFDPATLTLELRAVRNITEGEQITVGFCYLLDDHKTRQKDLSLKYKFKCACPYCTSSETDVGSDRRRDRIHRASSEYSDKIWWSFGIDRIIQIHKDVLEAIELEGLQAHSFDHIRWLVRAYSAIGDVENTRYWARKAAAFPTLCNNSADAVNERHLWYIVSADVTKHPDWNSRKSEAISAGPAQKRTESGRVTYTDLQMSSLKSAEMAYKITGLPSMGRVLPYRECYFCIWIVFEDLSDKYTADHVYGLPSSLPQPLSYHVGPVPRLGRGLIADKAIPVGGLIVSERPAVLYPADFFNPTYPSGMFDQGKFEVFLEELVPSLDEKVYASLLDLPDPGGETVGSKIHRIASFNSVVVNFPQSQFLHRYRGVFPTLARCNHSCAPNAALAFDAKRLVIELRAARAISPGDEITFAYCDVLKSYSARQKELSELHNFRCRCQYCITHANDLRSDERRAKILLLIQDKISSLQIDLRTKAKRYEEILIAIDEENLQQFRVKCLIKLSEVYRMLGDVQKVLSCYTRGLMNYVAPVDGIEDFEKRDSLQSAAMNLISELPILNDIMKNENYARGLDVD